VSFHHGKELAGYEISDCRRRRRPSVPELKEGSKLRVLMTERWVQAGAR
jgi:hypothetical protein